MSCLNTLLRFAFSPFSFGREGGYRGDELLNPVHHFKRHKVFETPIRNYLVVCILLFPIFVSCTGLNSPEDHSDFSFITVDVDQGLAQIGMVDTHAIAFDLGKPEQYSQWEKVYKSLGSPYLHYIVVSHRDSDHRGGLERMPETVRFSGIVVTHPGEDTAFIREKSGAWREGIRFHLVRQGDTLDGLPGVRIACLWPRDSIPEPEDNSAAINRYSLCFRLTHGNTSVLVTSDIDTVATKELGLTYSSQLHSDIIIVPHHGSASALDPVFYGHVNPSAAIIPCGLNNSYGHPAENVCLLLFMMEINVFETRHDGTVTGRSNGEYWQWETEF